MRIIKKYLDKNLFYVSVILTGITSFLTGLFYLLFKNSVFEKATENYLEGTGVLSSYITVQTSQPASFKYFLIGLVISIIFFFLISLVLHIYLKQKYFLIFNNLAILNVVLIIALIISSIIVSFSQTISFIILILAVILYLFLFNICLSKFWKINFKKRMVASLIILIFLIVILIFLKLFV